MCPTSEEAKWVCSWRPRFVEIRAPLGFSRAGSIDTGIVEWYLRRAC